MDLGFQYLDQRIGLVESCLAQRVLAMAKAKQGLLGQVAAREPEIHLIQQKDLALNQMAQLELQVRDFG